MTVSKTAAVDLAKASRRKDPADGAAESGALQMGELSELLGYSLKRAQLKIFEDFIRCVAPLQLTPAQFSVLLLLDKNPGRNQTEIANTLGILRPNFVAMLDALESRDLPDDVERAGIFRDVLYERAIDLDLVERKALQIGQRGIAGAKIVHRDPD